MNTLNPTEGDYHKLGEDVERLKHERQLASDAASIPPTPEQQAEIDWYNQAELALRAEQQDTAQKL